MDRAAATLRTSRHRRVLVTGGAGFIGAAVVERLVQAGHEVVVVDALLPTAHAGPTRHGHPDATHVTVDLTDAAAIDELVRGVDAVCHQAAMVGLGVDFDDVVDYVRNNSAATAVLLRALHRAGFTGRIVLASSMVVYGEGSYRCPVHGDIRPAPRAESRLRAGQWEQPCPRCGRDTEPQPITEDAATAPQNVYAATKLEQEHLCRSYAREHGSSFVALRYHNVYGPHMPRDTPYSGVAALFRSALARGEAPRVFEDGRQRRDFVHVADVARANELALDAPDHVSGAYNIATGRPRTVLDLATALAEATKDFAGASPVVVGGARAGDVRHVFASPRRARDELGFEARISFEEGIAGFADAPLRSG